MIYHRVAVLAGLCLLTAPSLVCAQTLSPQAEPGVTVQDCRTPAPNNNAQQGQTRSGESLSATLDKCNGVLQPPSVGDSEIREQAPKVGDTPVIPPSAVPDQPAVNPG